MPVTLNSSPAARGRADRQPDVALAYSEFGGGVGMGPGVFSAALREALEEGDIRRPSNTTFAPPESQPDQESGGER
jgi:hypothetical protein